MKNKWMCMIAVLLVALLLNVQTGAGQNPPPEDEPVPVEAPPVIDIPIPGALPIQGRLTDSNGKLLNGSVTIVFSLYDVATGGTAVCSQTRTVTVTNGLFSDYLDNCYNDLYGQKVWLGVKVGTDAEMTPRQVIYPVPYALNLVPGAHIQGAKDGILTVIGTAGGTGTADYDALYVESSAGGEAIEAKSIYGYGVYATSNPSTALYGLSFGTETFPAVYGCKEEAYSVCGDFDDNNPAGVVGASTLGDGMQGYTSDLFHRGIYATNAGGGTALAAYSNSNASANHWYPSLYLIQGNGTGDYVVGASSYQGIRSFRVDATGKGFFNGGTQASGADFAEQIASEGPASAYEPGDVLVISASQDRSAALSSEPFSTLVLGVYSTQPGYLAGAPDSDDPLGGLPVAVLGIVPCKVSAENGPIQRGDLLVTSSTPGHAMRAGDNPPVGAVLGKAMGSLDAGTGLIQVLVTLH